MKFSFAVPSVRLLGLATVALGGAAALQLSREDAEQAVGSDIISRPA
jgi:hypothetical protein